MSRAAFPTRRTRCSRRWRRSPRPLSWHARRARARARWRRRQWHPRRACRFRCRSISRGKTNRRPIVWASSASKRRASTSTAWRCSWSACRKRRAFPKAVRRPTCAITPSPPSASPKLRLAPPARPSGKSRIHSISTWFARWCGAIRERPRKRSCSSTTRWPNGATTNRSPLATGWSRRCCARRTSSVPSSSW